MLEDSILFNQWETSSSTTAPPPNLASYMDPLEGQGEQSAIAMSHITSGSREASGSSENREDAGVTRQAVKRKRNLPGNPDPNAEVIALSPSTLMATNRFFCEICSKGFLRDQNLQLHRRGHNLPWKLKQRTSQEIRKRVYICPEPSCVHHDPSRALGDLTGIKKHFCRKHGEKKWKCERCSKHYAVRSDWKAHSKTCGTREYRCECGTLFSRRDSFISHRAFCEAVAEENARISHQLPENNNSTSMLQHLMSNNVHGMAYNKIAPHNTINLTENIFPPQKSSPAIHPATANTWLAAVRAGPGPPAGGNTTSDLSAFITGGPQHLQSTAFLGTLDCVTASNMPYSHSLPANSMYGLAGDQGVSSIFNVPAAQMSATALLQRAAQVGATTSYSDYASPWIQSLGFADPRFTNPELPVAGNLHGMVQNRVIMNASNNQRQPKMEEGGSDTLTRDFLGVKGRQAMDSLSHANLATLLVKHEQDTHALLS